MKLSKLIPVLVIMSASSLLVSCANGTKAANFSSSSSSAGASASRSGVEGAVDFDQGYISLGSGHIVVDLYIDPMCPYCRAFERAQLPYLTERIKRGEATIRIHPIALLNRLSRGSQYSTRASAAIVDVASTSPNQVLNFVSALYDEQPPEDSAGLADGKLQDIERRVGVSAIVTQQATLDWVDQQTQISTTGPLRSTLDMPAIDHVPTVIVNGSVFPGGSSDVQGFREFLQDHK